MHALNPPARRQISGVLALRYEELPLALHRPLDILPDATRFTEGQALIWVRRPIMGATKRQSFHKEETGVMKPTFVNIIECHFSVPRINGSTKIAQNKLEEAAGNKTLEDSCKPVTQFRYQTVQKCVVG